MYSCDNNNKNNFAYKKENFEILSKEKRLTG